MSTSTLDSCNVQVTVRELRPVPCADPLRGTRSRHYALVEVVIGTMRVDGAAAFDESPATGALVLAGPAGGVDSLPMLVQEVLEDLGSTVVAARVREAIEAAVQQYDLDKGHLGDGDLATAWQESPFIRGTDAVPGSREWDDAMRARHRDGYHMALASGSRHLK